MGKMNNKELKIALIKQVVYQDLYVCGNNSTPEEMLFSSMCRVGPIGLFTLYDADFYILNEEKDKECQVWKKIIPGMTKEYRKLVNTPVNKIKGLEFYCPETDECNGDYSVSCNSIDWGKYDVVISINCSVPYRVVKKYQRTLWCYMIGEANFLQDQVYFGYDVSLNQLIRGEYNKSKRIIDFPYTFVGPDCLEKMISGLYGKVENKNGIYGEINTTTERPVKRIPQFEPISESTGQPIKVHKQKLRDNLLEIYNSKYYLKVGGRITRGNGAIEAISLGTMVLISPEDIICRQIIPKEAWVYNADDAIEKIKYFDNNPEEYNRVLNLERELVKLFVIDYPMEHIYQAHETKLKQGMANRFIYYGNIRYVKDIIKKMIARRKR